MSKPNNLQNEAEILRKDAEKLQALSEIYDDMSREKVQDELDRKTARLKMKICRDELLRKSMELDSKIKNLSEALKKI